MLNFKNRLQQCLRVPSLYWLRRPSPNHAPQPHVETAGFASAPIVKGLSNFSHYTDPMHQYNHSVNQVVEPINTAKESNSPDFGSHALRRPLHRLRTLL